MGRVRFGRFTGLCCHRIRWVVNLLIIEQAAWVPFDFFKASFALSSLWEIMGNLKIELAVNHSLCVCLS